MRGKFAQGFRLATVALLVALWVGIISANPAELTVCSSGCDYVYLNDAVKAASAGSVIIIKGVVLVKGDVVIDKSLTIQGVGESPAIWPLTPGGFSTTLLLDIVSGTVVIQDLTLQPEVLTTLAWPKFCPTVLRVRGTANVTLNNVKAWTRPGPLSDRGGIEVLDSAVLTMTGCSIVDKGAGDQSIKVLNSSTLTMKQCSVVGGSIVGLKVNGSPQVMISNSSLRFSKDGIWIEGGSPKVTIQESTMRNANDLPLEIAIYIKDLTGGKITLRANRGKVQKTVDSTLRITGAIGGSVVITNSQASITIGGSNSSDGNDIMGRSGPAGIAITSSKNITIQNNSIGYFGQRGGGFRDVPGIKISGDDTEVAISSNEIVGNGGCGVCVESAGATVTGSGNRIYLNCVSSKCQMKAEFKKCGANLCPCPGDYPWPSGFGGGA